MSFLSRSNQNRTRGNLPLEAIIFFQEKKVHLKETPWCQLHTSKYLN